MKRRSFTIASMLGAFSLAGPGRVGAQEPKPSRKGGTGFGENMESGSGGHQKPPMPKDESEKKILAALEEARHGERYANVSTNDGRLLRLLAETIGAKRVIELGTSTGESGIWFALALRKTGGHLYTHDIDPGRLKVARENYARAGVDSLITVIEGDAHETVSQHKEPIDLLFIDADKPGYPDYLEKLLPVVRRGGLIVAHNMHTPPPDRRYIEAITTNPDLDTSFLLMDAAGVGVTLKKR
ncbi:MAG: O-methyltransferase [Isosphaerales bacterium]